MLETKGREIIECGQWQVVGLPSIHGKALFGRVPLPGYDYTATLSTEISSPTAWSSV
jgi:hypothetical protein